MANESAIVQMSGVSKRFGKIPALDGVDVQVYPGRIIGLLGAGKSTLLRHICSKWRLVGKRRAH